MPNYDSPVQLAGAYTSRRKPRRDGNGNIIGMDPNAEAGMGFVDQDQGGYAAAGAPSYNAPNGGSATRPGYGNGGGQYTDAETQAAMDHPALRFDPGEDQIRKAQQRLQLKALEDAQTNADTQTLHDQMLARGGGPQTIRDYLPGESFSEDTGPSEIRWTDPVTGEQKSENAGPVGGGQRRVAVGSYSPIAARQARQDAGPSAFTDSASSYMDDHDAMVLHQLSVEDHDRMLSERLHAEMMGLQQKMLDAATNHNQLEYQAAKDAMNSPAVLAQIRAMDAASGRSQQEFETGLPLAKSAADLGVAQNTAMSSAYSGGGVAKVDRNNLTPDEQVAWANVLNSTKNPMQADSAVLNLRQGKTRQGAGEQESVIGEELGRMTANDSLINRYNPLTNSPAPTDQDVASEAKKINELIDTETAAGQPNAKAHVQAQLSPRMGNTPHMLALRRALGWQ